MSEARLKRTRSSYACVPQYGCSCCTCQGIMCMMWHPGHDCRTNEPWTNKPGFEPIVNVPDEPEPPLDICSGSADNFGLHCSCYYEPDGQNMCCFCTEGH